MKIQVNEIEEVLFNEEEKIKLIHGKISLNNTEANDENLVNALCVLGHVDMRELEKFKNSDKPVLISNFDTKVIDWMLENGYAAPETRYVDERYSYRYDDEVNDVHFNAIIPTSLKTFNKLMSDDEAFRYQWNKLFIPALNKRFNELPCFANLA